MFFFRHFFELCRLASSVDISALFKSVFPWIVQGFKLCIYPCVVGLKWSSWNFFQLRRGSILPNSEQVGLIVLVHTVKKNKTHNWESRTVPSQRREDIHLSILCWFSFVELHNGHPELEEPFLWPDGDIIILLLHARYHQCGAGRSHKRDNLICQGNKH